ncbi:hypothetical protein [Halalkalicoccus ordinarius]|uniref:hypothetical protein n=1 Tax=Halalkalicoccus ordinarius TaxID=3116651 RepID=UPI00300EE515
MSRNTHNADDRIYDMNDGWQANPDTGLNLVREKPAASQSTTTTFPHSNKPSRTGTTRTIDRLETEPMPNKAPSAG